MNPSEDRNYPALRRRWISSIIEYIDQVLEEDLQALEIQFVGQWVFLGGVVKEPSSRDQLRTFLTDSKDFELARFEVDIQHDGRDRQDDPEPVS